MSKKSVDNQGSGGGSMILHCLIGDGQLEKIPQDLLSIRLLIRAEGRDYSISSNWSGSSFIIRFHQTVHVPTIIEDTTKITDEAYQAAVSTRITFDLLGLINSTGHERTIGNTSCCVSSNDHSVTKILNLYDKAEDKVGRLSITFFYYKFPLDLTDSGLILPQQEILRRQLSNHNLNSKEYSFLLNRRLNWSVDKRASFDTSTEHLLDSDMTMNLRELHRSIHQQKTNSEALVKKTILKHGSNELIKGSYSPQVPLSSGRVNKSIPTTTNTNAKNNNTSNNQPKLRQTSFGVGYVGVAWPEQQDHLIRKEKILYQIKIADEKKNKLLHDIAEQKRIHKIVSRTKLQEEQTKRDRDRREQKKLKLLLRSKDEELKILSKIVDEKRKENENIKLISIKSNKSKSSSNGNGFGTVSTNCKEKNLDNFKRPDGTFLGSTSSFNPTIHSSKYYATKPDFHSRPKSAPQGYSSRITSKTTSKLITKSTFKSPSKSPSSAKKNSPPITFIPSDINIKDDVDDNINTNLGVISKDWLAKARNSVQRLIYNDNANASKELFENVDQIFKTRINNVEINSNKSPLPMQNNSTNTDTSNEEFDSLLLRKSTISAVSAGEKQLNLSLPSPTFALTEVTIDDDGDEEEDDDDVEDIIIDDANYSGNSIIKTIVDEESNQAWFETSDGDNNSVENKAIKVLLRNGARDIILTDSGSDASGSISDGGLDSDGNQYDNNLNFSINSNS